ncbi:hypothetical protein J6590_042611 [Homalodisca vitripennis]|nr:hypothetical protein J6590_042611 [Homalodisca vitripennis]
MVYERQPLQVVVHFINKLPHWIKNATKTKALKTGIKRLYPHRHFIMSTSFRQNAGRPNSQEITPVLEVGRWANEKEISIRILIQIGNSLLGFCRHRNQPGFPIGFGILGVFLRRVFPAYFSLSKTWFNGPFHNYLNLRMQLELSGGFRIYMLSILIYYH